jgi:5-methylcytosine-specific restriction enzyme B
MARQTNKSDLAPVLTAARQWIDRCLIEDKSIFFDEELWTLSKAEELQKHFVENPDESDLSFLEKLPKQLAAASPGARQLMAEILWAVRLFPTTPKAPTKRAQFLQAWQLCGRPLSEDHPMLTAAALGGIGSAGTAYLTGPWREIGFLIQVLLRLKPMPPDERAALFSSNEKLSPWLESLVEKGERQFPHILRYFTFPDTVERISSGPEKKKILKGFGIPYSGSLTALQVDQALFGLRQKQEAEHPGLVLDFYEAPLDRYWKKLEASKPDAEAEDHADDAGETDVVKEPKLPIVRAHPAINRIYYGPPGTGKTYRINAITAEYVETPESLTREAWLCQLVSRYSWHSVIAATLAQLTTATHQKLYEHELLVAMARAKPTNNNSQSTIRGTLQHHTPRSDPKVLIEQRVPPFLFRKVEEATWTLLPDWQLEDPEAGELAEVYAKGQRSAPPIRRYRIVTFHPSYSYEDFVRGIRPVGTGKEGRSEFRMTEGAFKQICDEARSNPTKRYALFIDEINRGNIAKIFGELITLIEPDKRITVASDGSVVSGMTVQLPGSNTGEVAEPPFGVPANLDLYGTMNTADRSIALLDVALRRRFEFVEMPPRYDASIFPASVAGVDRGKLLQRINDRLEYLLDRDHRIGHAYLMKAHSLDDLRSAFANQIIPLLQEYFFDDLGKVAVTLSGPDGASVFVRKEELNHSHLFAARSGKASGPRFRYSVTDSTQWTAEAFQSLYASTAATLETESDGAVG